MSAILIEFEKIETSSVGLTIVENLLSIGLQFENPETGRISRFDVDGNPIDVTKMNIENDFRSGVSGAVQLWFPTGEDVYFVWGLDLIQVFVSGTARSSAVSVMSALCQAFFDSKNKVAWDDHAKLTII